MIRVAVVGIGNCASSLVQLVAKSRSEGSQLGGLMHERIGKYCVADVEFVAAFDIDQRKVGSDLAQAIFSMPNCTTRYLDVPHLGVPVSLGYLDDGIGPELESMVAVHPGARCQTRADLLSKLRASRADVVVNFLPVGSARDSRFYALLACEAGCAFVNCNPELLATDPDVASRFWEAGVPILGDDIKSQLGSTMLHRAIADKLVERGAIILKTYQLNVGGNTDFLNMTSRKRASTKKHTKTSAMRAVLGEDALLSVGPSDHLPLLADRKVAYIRIEGKSCLGMDFSIETRLDVEDSPNAAGVAIDGIRCAKLAMDRGLAGVVPEPCAYLFKYPHVSYPEKEARAVMDAWTKSGIDATAVRMT